MVLKIWYSTFLSVVNALIVIYEIATKKKYKNQKIRELFGLPFQHNLQHNIVGKIILLYIKFYILNMHANYVIRIKDDKWTDQTREGI